MQALSIIIDAYERCNRLSPGETLGADDAAFGLRRLNLLVDELSAQNLFLFRDAITSAAQTGDITLGVGAWAAIMPGDEVISAVADNVPLSPITMQQYNALYQPATSALPAVYAQNGLSTVYLYPQPNGQTIRLQTRVGVKSFADMTTDYTLPNGYASALGAGLAVRIAPSVLGAIPAGLLRAEKMAMSAASHYEPAILSATAYQRSTSKAQGWVVRGIGIGF